MQNQQMSLLAFDSAIAQSEVWTWRIASPNAIMTSLFDLSLVSVQIYDLVKVAAKD